MYGEPTCSRPRIPPAIDISGKTLAEKSDATSRGPYVVTRRIESTLNIDHSYFSQESATDSPVTPCTPFNPISPETPNTTTSRICSLPPTFRVPPSDPPKGRLPLNPQHSNASSHFLSTRSSTHHSPSSSSQISIGNRIGRRQCNPKRDGHSLTTTNGVSIYEEHHPSVGAVHSLTMMPSLASISPRARNNGDCPRPRNMVSSPRSGQRVARSNRSRRVTSESPRALGSPRSARARRSHSQSSASCSSFESDYSLHSLRRQGSGPSKRKIECVCGRSMEMTKNPNNKYPPKAVLYCQQNGKCKKQMVVERDWHFCCRARTSVHGTKDGKFKICYSCALAPSAKQERVRRNHALLIQQLKNKERGKVIITEDTKRYILSSSSPNTRDETIRLLKAMYIEPLRNECKSNAVTNKSRRSSLRDGSGRRRRGESNTVTVDGGTYRVVKEGFMMKRGNFWNKSLKQRYFKLLENRTLIYYASFERGVASDERGTADLSVVDGMAKRDNGGLRILTPSREWKCQCSSDLERDAWYDAIARLCGLPQ